MVFPTIWCEARRCFVLPPPTLFPIYFNDVYLQIKASSLGIITLWAFCYMQMMQSYSLKIKKICRLCWALLQNELLNDINEWMKDIFFKSIWHHQVSNLLWTHTELSHLWSSPQFYYTTTHSGPNRKQTLTSRWTQWNIYQIFPSGVDRDQKQI